METKVDNISGASEEYWLRALESAVLAQESASNLGSGYTSDSGWKAEIEILKGQLADLNPGKNPCKVKFGDLNLKNIWEIDEWRKVNIPSKNWSTIVDAYVLMEHVIDQINPGKTTLHYLQVIYKLDIHSKNHGITLTSFENP